MQVIEVNLKSVYGEVKAYPINEAAKLFADLAGTKTLTVQSLKKIQALGYEIKAVDPLALAFA
jgi:hypothetical protein